MGYWSWKRVGLAVCGAIAVSALAGCAASGSARVARTLQPAAGEPVGWLAASLGARGGEFGPFNLHLVMFGSRDAKGRGQLALHVIGTSEGHEPEIDVVIEDRYFLQTYLVPLRPGRYEIDGGEMSSDSGLVAQWVDSEKGTSLPFEIRAGQITYIGSFTAETFGGENLFRQRIRAGGYYVVTDEKARDLELLAKKAALPAGNIEVIDSVPEFEEAGGIFIRFRKGDGRGLVDGRPGALDQ